MDFFWARGLKYLPSQFLRLLLLLVLFFTAQYSCWTILHILGFPDPSYSLGIFGPFYSLGHSRPISFSPSFLHSHGLLLNSLGFLGPIATSFSFGFIGLQTNSIYQFLYLVSSGFVLFVFFLFLMIPMCLLLHSLGLPWPVCFLWSYVVILWVRGPLFLPFGLTDFILLFYFLTLFSYCWASSVIGTFCQNGH